jgi:uncharacterized iron-regulated membrane protein
MDLRKYNIYFHTHTISGIIIAAILYVIFFAGSFSFFKDDISAWQKGQSVVANKPEPAFNHLIDSLAGKYELRGRSFDFYIVSQSKKQQRNEEGGEGEEETTILLTFYTTLRIRKRQETIPRLTTWESFCIVCTFWRSSIKYFRST